MLYPILYFLNDEGGTPCVVESQQRSFQPLLVISRELCIFEAVPCKGVAWHEASSFAALQAQRLSPHLDSGASAAVRSKMLMLWFWDESDVEAALQRAGHGSTRCRRIAETLMLDLPARQGKLELRCSHGTDSLTVVDGAIIASEWAAEAAGAPVPARVLRRSWARDLFGGQIPTAGGRVTARGSIVRAFTALATVAAVGFAVHSAYWGGSLLGARQHLAGLERDAETTMELARTAAELRRIAAEEAAWVATYRELGGTFSTDQFLQALARPLAAAGLVVKEMEVRNEEARLVLSSVSGEIDLPATLQLLSRMPGVFDVALADASDVRQATFNMKVPRYRQIISALTSLK